MIYWAIIFIKAYYQTKPLYLKRGRLVHIGSRMSSLIAINLSFRNHFRTKTNMNPTYWIQIMIFLD